MSLSTADLALYAGALTILFLTPGPVMLAMLARGVGGGFAAVWPLALGVVVGDILWPLIALTGLDAVADQAAPVLGLLKWIACVMFLWMGITLMRKPAVLTGADSRLTKPGFWGGFSAGLITILGNPKAVGFYLLILPGFFDLGDMTRNDIIAICAISGGVPLIGNLMTGGTLSQLRRFVASEQGMRRMNQGAGVALIVVGLILPFT